MKRNKKYIFDSLDDNMLSALYLGFFLMKYVHPQLFLVLNYQLSI
jgi:hypothetical protein